MGAKVVKLLATQTYSMLLGQTSCGNPAAKWIALVSPLSYQWCIRAWHYEKDHFGNPGSGSHPNCFTASVRSSAESDFTEHRARQ